MTVLFDIVIPVGPHDTTLIHSTVKYAQANIIGYRTIYLVSYDPQLAVEGCITIPETSYPFDIHTISKFTQGSSKTGWYLQQLLKLYAGRVVSNIMDNYLVIDADTMFLKPTTFIDDNNVPLYNVGTEYYTPYFDHMVKLHPTLTKQTNHSGICHHMLFQRHILEGLFTLVETYTGKPFWLSFMEHVTLLDGSGASEYEMYFNYLHYYHPDSFRIRSLHWRNVQTLHDIENSDFDYVSYHWYLR